MGFFNNIKNIISKTGVIRANTVKDNNPVFTDFSEKSSDSDKSIVHSVLLSNKKQQAIENFGGSFINYNDYKNFVYSPIPSNKISRLTYFREMAKFPEVADAIDEITDNCINYDERNRCINLEFTKLGIKSLDDNQKNELVAQFEEFIQLFDFDNNGYEYFKDFIIDGEIAWENIVNEQEQDKGIIALNKIKPEAFELLISPNFDIVGILVNALINYELLIKFMMCDGASGSTTESQKQMFTTFKGIGQTLNVYGNSNDNKNMIPFPLTQVTYVNTGKYNDTRTVVEPILERARKAYNQLQLIEDAIIIYRLTRAPERLIFKIATGKATPARAEQIVQQAMKRYQTKKVYNPSTGSIDSSYDPIQMSENYWFPKGSDGIDSDVTKLDGGTQLDQLADLNYFLRKLYLALKIPFDRFKTGGEGESTGGTDRYGNEGRISYEEYRFSKFIIKMQSQFAKGVVNSFYTHLKFIGLWKKYDMTEAMFKASFVPPTMYDIYMKQRLLKVRLENYDMFIKDHEEFAKEIGQRDQLSWTPAQIEENKKFKKREVVEGAYLERIVETVKSSGKLFESEGERDVMQQEIGGMGQMGDSGGGFPGHDDLSGMGSSQEMGGSEPSPEESQLGAEPPAPEPTPEEVPAT